MESKRIAKTVLSVMLVLMFVFGAVGGAMADAGAIDTSKEVHIRMHVWGEAPEDKAPLALLSEKIKEKVNATFEIVSLGWDGAAFDLLLASGEECDLLYVGGGYSTTARSGALLPLDDLLATYAPQSLKNTSPEAWEQAKVDGTIYAVPFRFTEFIPGGLTYRGDLLKKYGMEPIQSIEDMATYFDHVLAEGGTITPFMPETDWSGWYLGEMYINQTKDYIPLDVVTGMMFTGESFDKPEVLSYPVFDDAFIDFAKMMKDWDTKGYWSKDILSTTAQPNTEFMAGKTAAYFDHAQGYIGTYGDLLDALPSCDPMYFCFVEANQKVLRQHAMANGTGLSITSKNPERALMVLDLLLNDREINQLCQYGVRGKNYELDANGNYIRPEGYDEAKDSYNLGTWNLNVDEFRFPSLTEYPGKEELLAKLESIAHVNPYAGFAFDNTNVMNEVAAVNQVNSQIGTEILLGKVDDPVKAVEDYRAQLKAAGIDTLTEELTAQVKAFLGK